MPVWCMCPLFNELTLIGVLMIIEEVGRSAQHLFGTLFISYAVILKGLV